MVDYSKMSNFEINCEVAKANGWTSKSFAHEIHSGKWNPCQNPADAWPIIVGSKINIRFGAEGMVSEAQYIQYGYESVEYYHANPLRAAMIVFMMMQEGK